MHYLEYVLLAIMIAMPIYTALSHEKNKLELVEGRLTRVAAYQQTILFLWLPTLVLGGVLWFSPLTTADIGLSLNWDLALILGLITLVILAILAALGLKSLLRDEKALTSVRESYAPLSWFLPSTKNQWRWFVYGVSSTAGICEELLFRGYLIWLLTPHMGIAGAIIASSLLFGLNHIYQGWGGVLKTALIGLLLAGVYWLTGSLWIAILLHILIDVYAGTQAYIALRTGPTEQRLDAQPQNS